MGLIGLEKEPNMTGKILPKVPPLINLMGHYGMQNDMPNANQYRGRQKHYDDYDDDQPSASKVISFSQRRKVPSFLFKALPAVNAGRKLKPNLVSFFHSQHRSLGTCHRAILSNILILQKK